MSKTWKGVSWAGGGFHAGKSPLLGAMLARRLLTARLPRAGEFESMTFAPHQKAPLFGIAAVGFALGVRGLAALTTDLYFDEAYYWVWAQRLDWSYFDHPPLIAWLMALLGARATALLCGLATTLVVFFFAKDVHGEAVAGWRAAALWSAVPVGALAGVFATPDSPLLLFWALGLWGLYRQRWLAAGAACGLALLSKYNAVLLALVFSVQLLRERRIPAGAWLTLLMGLLVFSPVVFWNVQHDWAGFAFQLGHGLGGGGGLRSLGEYLAGQLAMGGPVFVGLALWWIARGDRAHLLLRAAAAVPLLAFALASFKARGEANWPAVAYVAAAVGLGGVSTRWFKPAVATGLAVIAGGVLHVSHPLIHFQRDVPLERTHGWRDLARLKDRDPQVIFSHSYQFASEAAYYTRVPTAVLGSGRRTQFDLWSTPELSPGRRGLWLSDNLERDPPPELRARYAVGEPQKLTAAFGGRVLREFVTWELEIPSQQLTSAAAE